MKNRMEGADDEQASRSAITADGESARRVARLCEKFQSLRAAAGSR